MQNKLFQPIKINGLELKNRFVMSAAADNLDGKKDLQIARFSKLAKGGIGLIISGGTRINKIESWRDVIKAIHAEGGKFALQIVITSGPGKIPWLTTDEDAIAVSELTPDNEYFNSPFIKYGKHHAASENEILEIINIYAKAALLVKEIGADAVQIHAAHQNFLSQFLSPITNKRTDKWGGSIENRTRIHCEIYKAIRAKVGDNFPVLCKLGVEDAYDNGLKFNEGKIAAQIIAKCGYDALEISQGLQNMGLINFAKNILDFSGTPMRTGINNIKDETDLIGMCRPFIREPELIKRWQGGDHRKATCISCNRCCELLIKGEPLECALDKR